MAINSINKAGAVTTSKIKTLRKQDGMNVRDSFRHTSVDAPGIYSPKSFAFIPGASLLQGGNDIFHELYEAMEKDVVLEQKMESTGLGSVPARAIHVESDNSYIIPVPKEPGSIFTQVAKVDGKGNEVWRSKEQIEIHHRPITDKQGNIYFTAGGLNTRGFVALDKNGKTLWKADMGENSPEYGPKMKTGEDGTVYAITKSRGGNYWHLASIKDGNKQWEQRIGYYTKYYNKKYPIDVALTSRKNILVSAFEYNFDKKDYQHTLFVFNPDGSIRLKRKHPGLRGMKEGPDGKIYALQRSMGEDNEKLTALKPNGKPAWTVDLTSRLGAKKGDLAEIVGEPVFDKDGNVMVAAHWGYSHRAANDNSGNKSFLMKFNPKGKKMWEKEFTGTAELGPKVGPDGKTAIPTKEGRMVVIDNEGQIKGMLPTGKNTIRDFQFLDNDRIFIESRQKYDKLRFEVIDRNKNKDVVSRLKAKKEAEAAGIVEKEDSVIIDGLVLDKRKFDLLF